MRRDITRESSSMFICKQISNLPCTVQHYDGRGRFQLQQLTHMGGERQQMDGKHNSFMTANIDFVVLTFSSLEKQLITYKLACVCVNH